jgi:hypothetical protein
MQLERKALLRAAGARGAFAHPAAGSKVPTTKITTLPPITTVVASAVITASLSSRLETKLCQTIHVTL